MSDIRIERLTGGVFDWVIEDGDIANEDGFDTVLFVSLFTDARAPETIVLKPENRRGWMGDIESPIEGRQLGGLLWLASPRRLNQKTLNEVLDYARKSLSWITEDGLAKRIEVSGNIVPKYGITLSIIISVAQGETVSRFIKLWEVTGNAN